MARAQSRELWEHTWGLEEAALKAGVGTDPGLRGGRTGWPDCAEATLVISLKSPPVTPRSCHLGLLRVYALHSGPCFLLLSVWVSSPRQAVHMSETET